MPSADYISATDKQCPKYNASTLTAPLLTNNTKYAVSADQLADLICAYFDVLGERELLNFASAMIKILSCTLGVISSILSLIIFTRKEFQAISFMYHRTVNFIDLLNSLLYLDDALSYLIDTETQFSNVPWIWCRAYIFNGCNYVCANWVLVITVWIAVERAIACTMPRVFPKINRKSVCRIVILITFILTAAIYIPQEFRRDYIYDYKKNMYIEKASLFSKSADFAAYTQFTTAFHTIIEIIMISATICTIGGLISMNRRKKKLASNNLNNNRDLLKEYSANRQLGVLQLCESMPLILHECLRTIYEQILPSTTPDFILTQLPFDHTGAFDQSNAMSIVLRFRIASYLQVIIRGVSLLAHCCHFYWYVIFSRKVRRYVMRNWFNRNGVTTDKVSMFVTTQMRDNMSPRLVTDN